MNSAATLSFESLPIWKGVQSRSVFEVAPFQLSVHQDGYIYQSTERLVLQEVERAYADSKYQFITKPPGNSEWSNRIGNTYISYLEDCFSDLTNKSILEVGAGSFYIARNLITRHAIARYVVVDPAVKDEGELEDTIELRSEYFDADKIEGKFDIVVSFNTLEHVPHPNQFVKDITRVLKSEGKVLLVFPDISEQFNRGDLNSLIHEHMNYFTLASAAFLFASCAFKIVRRDCYEETLYFLLESHQNSMSNGETDSESVLQKAKVIFPRNLKETSKRVKRDVAAGKRVAFHGACNGLNNFAFLSGIKPTPNLLVFDSDASKENMYISTLDTPILNAEHPSYKTCDVVYIAAMTYFDEIRDFVHKKHNFPYSKIKRLFDYSCLYRCFKT